LNFHLCHISASQENLRIMHTLNHLLKVSIGIEVAPVGAAKALQVRNLVEFPSVPHLSEPRKFKNYAHAKSPFKSIYRY
ncbi:MAG: hypothetical protein ACK559_35575, partial [bacterium]